jgi:hypothetical protein
VPALFFSKLNNYCNFSWQTLTAPNLQALQLVDVPRQMIQYRTNSSQLKSNSMVTSGENNISFTAYINISALSAMDGGMVPLQWLD